MEKKKKIVIWENLYVLWPTASGVRLQPHDKARCLLVKACYGDGFHLERDSEAQTAAPCHEGKSKSLLHIHFCF